MNGLKVFTNEDFGDVAVISIDNKPYFEGIKVARILGYKNPNDAIKRHCAMSFYSIIRIFIT